MLPCEIGRPIEAGEFGNEPHGRSVPDAYGEQIDGKSAASPVKEARYQGECEQQDEIVGEEPPLAVVGDLKPRDVPEEGGETCLHVGIVQCDGDGHDDGKDLEVGNVEALDFGERKVGE